MESLYNNLKNFKFIYNNILEEIKFQYDINQLKKNIIKYQNVYNKITFNIFNFPFNNINIDNIFKIKEIETYVTYNLPKEFNQFNVLYFQNLNKNKYKFYYGLPVLVFYHTTKTKHELKIIYIESSKNQNMYYNIIKLLSYYNLELLNYIKTNLIKKKYLILFLKNKQEKLCYYIANNLMFDFVINYEKLIECDNNNNLTLFELTTNNDKNYISLDIKNISFNPHIFTINDICLELKNHSLYIISKTIELKIKIKNLYDIFHWYNFYEQQLSKYVYVNKKVLLFNPFFNLEKLINFYNTDEDNIYLLLSKLIDIDNYFIINNILIHKDKIKTYIINKYSNDIINNVLMNIPEFKIIKIDKSTSEYFNNLYISKQVNNMLTDATYKKSIRLYFFIFYILVENKKKIKILK